jgi:MoxR-like ATPase
VFGPNLSTTPPAGTPLDTYRHDVPDEWRILATLNDRDRDLLFDIPYALLRRFAVIQVPNPPTLY